jgi:hypothetical protein
VIVDIITPSVRANDLALVYLSSPKRVDKGRIKLNWHIVLDYYEIPVAIDYLSTAPNVFLYLKKGEPGNCGGNIQRNFALDIVKGDYVYFLDDDNAFPYKFWSKVPDLMRRNPGCVLVFDQLQKDGSPRLHAAHENMRGHQIDTAQFLTPRDLISDLRWKVDDACADGVFFTEIYKRYPERFRFFEEPKVYWNKLAIG